MTAITITTVIKVQCNRFLALTLNAARYNVMVMMVPIMIMEMAIALVESTS